MKHRRRQLIRLWWAHTLNYNTAEAAYIASQISYHLDYIFNQH